MRWWPTVLFSAVCLLSGSLWLLPSTPPSVSISLGILVVGAVTSALSVLCVCGLFAATSVFKWQRNWALALSGIGVLGAPALLLLWGRQHFSSVMAVAVQASIPVIVVIASGVLQERADAQQKLVPGLIALGGSLLVLPVALPKSSQGWAGFGLYLIAACLTGVCSVLCHREMIRVPAAVAIGIPCIANAIFLSVFAVCWLTITGQWHATMELRSAPNLIAAITVALNVTGVAGLLYLLRPHAAAVRFVFAPLLAAVEAYALMRPTLSLRTVMGALLMLIGGIACLQADREQEASTLMSLH